MRNDRPLETFSERRVSYTVEIEGRLVIVEGVPARVCVETGEQYFSAETVEALQKLVWAGGEPDRVVETPVYEFAA